MCAVSRTSPPIATAATRAARLTAAAEVVAAALDRRSVVKTYAYFGGTVALQQLVRDPQPELDGPRGIRDAEHERVPDRLHVRPAPHGELFVYSFEELGNQVCGLFVAVSLGQGGVAGDVGEQERRRRRFRRRCGRLVVIIRQSPNLSSVLPAVSR